MKKTKNQPAKKNEVIEIGEINLTIEKETYKIQSKWGGVSVRIPKIRVPHWEELIHHKTTLPNGTKVHTIAPLLYSYLVFIDFATANTSNYHNKWVDFHTNFVNDIPRAEDLTKEEFDEMKEAYISKETE